MVAIYRLLLTITYYILSASEIGVQSKAVSPSVYEESIVEATAVFILVVNVIAIKNRSLFIIFLLFVFQCAKL